MIQFDEHAAYLSDGLKPPASDVQLDDWKNDSLEAGLVQRSPTMMNKYKDVCH